MKTLKYLNVQYALLNACYFMLICGTLGYANNYLLYKGFTPNIIGLVLTIVSILTLVLQTTVALMIDHSKTLSEKKFILFALGISVLSVSLCHYLPSQSIFFLPSIVIGFAFAGCVMPFFNSLAFAYTNQGYKINYGLGRGVGSAFYAIGGMVIGRLIAQYTELSIPLYIIVFSLFTIIVLFSLQEPKKVLKQHHGKKGYIAFFRKYPQLILVVCAMICLFFAHTLINTFLYNVIVNIGGNASDQGNAIFIQAMVELPAMFGFSLILKRIRIEKILWLSAFFYVVKHILITIASNMVIFQLAMGSQMVSYALLIPASVYFASAMTHEDDRNQGQAIMASTTTVGGLFSSAIGGILFSMLQVHQVMWIGTLMTAVGFILMTIGLFHKNKMYA